MEQKILIEQYCFTLGDKQETSATSMWFVCLHSGGPHIRNASRKFNMKCRETWLYYGLFKKINTTKFLVIWSLAWPFWTWEVSAYLLSCHLNPEQCLKLPVLLMHYIEFTVGWLIWIRLYIFCLHVWEKEHKIYLKWY